MDRLLNAFRDQLQHAETALVCADMIDNNTRRDSEIAHWRTRVATLKHELAIAEAETVEPFDDVCNPYGSGPLPIEPRKE